MSDPGILATPTFTKSVVQDNRADGYWVETFMVDPSDRYPGLIGFGVKSGEICILDNPLNGGPAGVGNEWKKYLVKKFPSPSAIALGDCAGNGRLDIIACYDYGESLTNCNPKGGHISWLENPGRNDDMSVKEEWQDRYIGRWPSMHRIAAGYFTQTSILELIALPIIHGPQDIETPVPVTLFQRPERSLQAIEWNRSIIDDETFTVIHDAAVKKFDFTGGRETLFIASRNGIDWIYSEGAEWRREHINDGLPKEPGNDFYGSACVGVGRVGTDPAGYILTIDPYHGTLVTALTKTKTGPRSHYWNRYVLDEYGTPEQLQHTGKGPGHYIQMGDFDGDGDDEALVALMGPSPHAGVYYYKALDIQRGLFAKWKVSDESAARIAIGNFTGNGKLDFATIMYNDPSSQATTSSKIHLYTHDFAAAASDPDPEIVATIWAAQPLCYVPAPTELRTNQVKPLLEVAGYHLDLEIMPPSFQITSDSRAAVKVLFGELHNGESKRRALSVEPFTKASARLESGIIRTGDEGAIFISFTPTKITGGWSETPDVPVSTLFQPSFSQLQLPQDLKFVKVEDLAWGGDFKGIDFWNMSGIEIRFLNKTQLCHLQFWTAGKEVDCGLHNHELDFFLEVHMSLSAGTGNGGMWSVRTDDEDAPKIGRDLRAFHYFKIPLDDLEEHGPLWHMEDDGKPTFTDTGAVKYPFHKWQAGDQGDNLDIWVAFEFNPRLKYN